MIAYFGEQSLKDAVLRELDAHRKADRIIRGAYWKAGRGCAVGCLTKRSGGQHHLYERMFGIPTILARLEDRLFESIPADHLDWPHRFMNAIPVGADLSLVWPRWALWLTEEFLPQYAKTERAKTAIAGVAAQHRMWVETGMRDEAGMRYAAAAALAAYADAAAYYAAASAYYAAASATAYYADAAAYYAAASATAAGSASGRGSAYVQMADKLIELLEQAPVHGAVVEAVPCDRLIFVPELSKAMEGMPSGRR